MVGLGRRRWVSLYVYPTIYTSLPCFVCLQFTVIPPVTFEPCNGHDWTIRWPAFIHKLCNTVGEDEWRMTCDEGVIYTVVI